MAWIDVWEIGACGCSAPPPTTCPFLTQVVLCNNVGLTPDDPAPIFCTVNWWTDSTMTTLIASGLNNEDIYLGVAGTYYRQIIGARFATQEASIETTCNHADMTTLTPANGYHCFTDEDDGVQRVYCPYPLSDTLHCTFPAMAPTSVTFTYAAGLWTSSFSWSGHAYVITLAPNADMTATRNGTAFATGTPVFAMYQNVGGGPRDSCPVTGPFAGSIWNSVTPTDPGYELDPDGLGAIITE